MRLVVLVVASALSGTAVPASPNTLRYQLGGIMSGPIDLTINLDSGRFVVEEATLPRSKAVSRQTGALDAASHRRIRRLAEAAVSRGLETKACRQAKEPRPPIADAIRSMTLNWRGKQATAPDTISCWSKAADALASTAYADVHASALASRDKR